MDRKIRTDPRSKTLVRKVVSGGAFLAFAAGMIGLRSATSAFGATSLLVLCKIASSAHVCGFKSNYLDQTSKHAGSFSGASNTLATLSATVSPLVFGRVADQTRAGWNRMFLLIAAVNVSALGLWAAAASGESLDEKLSAPLDKPRDRAKGGPGRSHAHASDSDTGLLPRSPLLASYKKMVP